MIKKMRSERIDFLISNMVPEGVMRLNPIIAGSSMLSVYRAVRLHDTNDRWAQFVRRLEKTPKTCNLDHFGDVDIWFEESSNIHDISNENSHLVSGTPWTSPDDCTAAHISKVGLAKIGLRPIVKNTKWANSYCGTTNDLLLCTRITNPPVSYQFIKSKPKSPCDLINTFDFINSMVAYQDGVLYYDSRIDDAFRKFELQLNDDSAYVDKTIASRVFNALRAFKYSSRYGLDFEDRLSGHIFDVYSGIGSIDYASYNDRVVELESLYGRKISSVKVLESMVASLDAKFKEFISMRSFKQEYALFLINRTGSLSGLKEYINMITSDKSEPTQQALGSEQVTCATPLLSSLLEAT